MAHLVEATDTIATRQGDARAWHGLDSQHDFAAMTLDTLVTALGLEHTMDLDPLARHSTGIAIPNLYGIFSGRTGECVNQVTERFTVVQPREFSCGRTTLSVN